jgi:hypothetical protein
METKNVLNPEYLARRDFNEKLANMPDDENVFKAGMKLAQKTSFLQVNFENARRANLAVLKLRTVKSHAEIIRYVWDFENMTFDTKKCDESFYSN